MDYPQYIDVGVSYRPNEKWNFEFNLDWTDWDAINTSRSEQPALPPERERLMVVQA